MGRREGGCEGVVRTIGCGRGLWQEATGTRQDLCPQAHGSGTAQGRGKKWRSGKNELHVGGLLNTRGSHTPGVSRQGPPVLPAPAPFCSPHRPFRPRGSFHLLLEAPRAATP